ncbi:MAG: pantoate--beta-alanine ligase [Phycisphaerae bacterium]
MQIAKSIADARASVDAARRAGQAIRFVPTMGALHAGHRSLIDAARRGGGFVVVSIFVNPLQFGPNEDFAKYPRREDEDLRSCESAGVDLLFLPTRDELYPDGAVTRVRVNGLSEHLCGAFRPGHFEGVATIVSKLFNIVRPDAAYFGQKDAQQLAVIRRLVADLDFPIEVVGCPTVREPDGLALSSRNAYLTSEQRAQATCLNAALRHAEKAIQGGVRDASPVIDGMLKIIESAAPTRIDYVSVVNPRTLTPVRRIDGTVLIALAVRIGGTRLIDNLLVTPGA